MRCNVSNINLQSVIKYTIEAPLIINNNKGAFKYLTEKNNAIM